MALIPKPEKPSALANKGLDGAKAAATYFLDLYPYALSSTSKAEVVAMSDPECIFCASVVEKVEDRRSAGTHELGGVMTYSDVGGYTTTDKLFLITVTARQQPSKTVDSAGKVVKNYPRTTDNDISLAIERKGGQWLVREVTVEASRDA